VITIELNLWPSKVVGHSPINVPRDESGATRQVRSNTQTAGREALKLTGTTYFTNIYRMDTLHPNRSLLAPTLPTVYAQCGQTNRNRS